jgi:DNA-binding transcriptional LysR family regulator
MNNDPPLPVLRAIKSIKRTGSVSQTASELGVTQSAVSRSISKYEKAIGLRLVNREARPLKLTQEGMLVAAHAIEIERELQSLSSRLKALRQGKAGEVRIGSFGPSASSRILPDLIFRFNKIQPGISVSILEGSDELTRKDLISGKVDIAVLCYPIDEFDAIPVETDHLVALIPDGSSRAKQETISPSDLRDEPFVMTLAGSEPAILEWFTAAGLTLNIKHRVQQTHFILALVREGMGVAIVTSLSFPEEFHGVVVKSLGSASRRQIYVVKKPVSAKSNAAGMFWDFLNRTLNVG